MKEKITQLSKEIFEYELPKIILSEEKIEFEVESGKEYRGSITIKNNKNAVMKGLSYSSLHSLHIETPSFAGKENEIAYTFSAEEFEEKQDITGNIIIVSSCGEITVPFAAHIIPPYVETKIGKINDLFHFANLAKIDWTEAVHLFKAKEFEKIFLHRDTENKVLYRSLMKGISTSQALEEFLIANNKKPRIQFDVDKKEKKYKVTTETVADKIILTKNHWGYMEIRVSTDNAFIIPDHKIVWGDNFIGNNFILDIVLNPAKMRHGINKGKIILQTISQIVEVEIEAECIKESVKADPDRKKKKELSACLVNNYLKFRSNHITVGEYVEKTEQVLQELEKIEYTKSLELFKIHSFLLGGEEETAKKLLASLDKEKEKLEKEQIDVFCGYMYLKALVLKQESDVEEAVKLISKHYKQEYRKWNILWYLLFLDKRFESNKTAKLRAIREQFDKGCYSPVLYYEVCSLYNESPVMLKELDPFNIQVINMGVKLQCLKEKVIDIFADLAGKQKKFHQLIFKNLVELYHQWEKNEILSSICSMLIKGEKIGKDYIKWYQLGIEKKLKITELHEYYMYSLEEDTGELLPMEIYLYFKHGNLLPEKKKALLFVNIIHCRNEYPRIYAEYQEQIVEFVKSQLALHKIDSQLAFLYCDCLLLKLFTQEEEKQLPYVMFIHKMTCRNTKLIGIYIVHKECREECYVAIENREALIPMFTENAKIFFADANGNRYIKNIQEYTLEKLIPFEKYAARCYEAGNRNEMLLLYLFEQAEKYQYDGGKFAAIKYMVDDSKLRNGYQRKYQMSRIRYYYDHYEEEKLESLILDVDLGAMYRSDKIEIMEIGITRGLYEKIFEDIAKFGYMGVDIKKIMRLCTKMLQKNKNVLENMQDETTKRLFCEMCYYVFQKRKYDTYILEYLIDEYVGTTKEMFQIWREAKEKEMPTTHLEERLLSQMLFTESYIPDSARAFISYYKAEGNEVLKKAFLCYSVYKYLMFDRITPKEIFEIIKKELFHEEKVSYMLALLKYYSELQKLSEEQKKLADYYLNQFVEEGKILPFFKRLKNKVELPSEVSDRYFVEYKTNPGHTVKIHYLIENEQNNQEYITETMENIYQGIFVKSFTLFYNEILQYYITEIDGMDVNITESIMVKADADFDVEEDRYNQLNLMLMAQEVQDEKTLLELIDNYIRTDYASKEAFKML